LPVQNFLVQFYDGDPQQGGVLIGEPITVTNLVMGGATQAVSVTWTVPNDGWSHVIYVVVDPSLSIEDRDRSNNSASGAMILPDLQVASCWNSQVSASSKLLGVRIINAGRAAAGAFNVSWRLGSADGVELGRTPVDALAAGQATEVAWGWDVPQWAATNIFVAIYAIADSDGAVEESDESNNVAAQVLSVAQASAAAITSCTVENNGVVRLTFVVAGLAVSASVIESAPSLDGGGAWSVESGASVTNTAAGMYEATVPVRDGVGFYRLHWGP
jgi:subtilase family serine protease